MSAGRPVEELSDTELEEQGTQSHATRNWVFLHGTAEQFATHTERMLALEQEYLRRFPKRTWQGTSDSPVEVDEATRLRLALRGLATQIDALLSGGVADGVGTLNRATSDPATLDPAAVSRLLSRVAAAGGRVHKLELHQAAREAGLRPAALAALYRGENALLAAERDERVLTGAGRASLGDAT